MLSGIQPPVLVITVQVPATASGNASSIIANRRRDRAASSTHADIRSRLADARGDWGKNIRGWALAQFIERQ
jgi:hypothetical protein